MPERRESAARPLGCSPLIAAPLCLAPPARPAHPRRRADHAPAACPVPPWHRPASPCRAAARLVSTDAGRRVRARVGCAPMSGPIVICPGWRPARKPPPACLGRQWPAPRRAPSPWPPSATTCSRHGQGSHDLRPNASRCGPDPADPPATPCSRVQAPATRARDAGSSRRDTAPARAPDRHSDTTSRRPALRRCQLPPSVLPWPGWAQALGARGSPPKSRLDAAAPHQAAPAPRMLLGLTQVFGCRPGVPQRRVFPPCAALFLAQGRRH